MSDIIKDNKAQLEFEINPREKISLGCYVISVEKDRINLAFPNEGYKYSAYLQEAVPVKTSIFTDGGIVILNSIIIDPPDEGILTIEYKDDYEVVQRRQNFRVFHSTLFKVKLKDKVLKTRTIDVSGGGIRFRSEERIKVDNLYDATLVLSNPPQEIFVKGRVYNKNPNKPNEYVMEFMGIEEKEREKIIKYCTYIERERNKKY